MEKEIKIERTNYEVHPHRITIGNVDWCITTEELIELKRVINEYLSNFNL